MNEILEKKSRPNMLLIENPRAQMKPVGMQKNELEGRD